MSGFTEVGDDVAAIDTSANGQLVTPALSPISDHAVRDVPNLSSYVWKSETVRTPLSELQRDTEIYASNSNISSNGHASEHRRDQSISSPRPAKLSPTKLQELIGSPESLPVRAIDDKDAEVPALSNGRSESHAVGLGLAVSPIATSDGNSSDHSLTRTESQRTSKFTAATVASDVAQIVRPAKTSRSASTPLVHRKQSSTRPAKVRPLLEPIRIDTTTSAQSSSGKQQSPKIDGLPSPLPNVIPIPPLSLPTYLQLELSSSRPSPLYIHHSESSDFPYESSRAKFERLLNFFLLPPILEQVLWFGAAACLDSWLYTFTILPLRFLKALTILFQWMFQNVTKEALDISAFVYEGVGRVWRRQRRSYVPDSRRPSTVDATRLRKLSNMGVPIETSTRPNHVPASPVFPESRARKSGRSYRHRRTKSMPSALLPNHKADLLQGLLIILSCILLMGFDASRMYHSIRGQAAIKLYVIYNMLEVFDRLFSALGQDVLECLFSKETLERDEYGRSKVFRPLWMFMLALVYNVIHSAALFYQVVTLNVAVNSYSNALLTLLMSNQFVEIKGTVFKKFEKENLFQLTCADVVERFQLWLMLLIIALRNIVEVGGLTVSLKNAFGTATESASSKVTGIPLASVIPKAFTLLPKWTGEVLGPFLIVMGSEALVDWCKHAYITKFNNVKPNIYGRFLDVLAKDYYIHAFADQNLTKRLGLPVIPLSCLFIRACMQTYHMFLATHMPMPIASPGTSVALDAEAPATSPATTAALQHIDRIFRRALGRSSFGAAGNSADPSHWWSIDDIIAFATMVIFFLALYFVLLALKLLLGMALLSYARRRYAGMKAREKQSTDTQGRRVGGWGMVEVGEDKRRWIYEDDPDGLRELREKEERGRRRTDKGETNKLDGVQRYSMAAKRIW